MILIHTGDLHLGKTLHERYLHDEQAAMLEALLALVLERRPAALLLAGDLYDRAIPPPDAIELFDSFLSRLVEGAPEVRVVAIPGNHDSASRLSFGAGLFRRAGVHFRLRPEDYPEPVIVEGGGGERCAIWALPFLGAGIETVAFEAGAGGGTAVHRGQAERFAAAVGRIVPRLLPGSHNVLLAHCFASGGSPSESERAFVGLAEEVDARLFDSFDYAALGHLHRPQKAGAKGAYPGSPLAYSFGDSGAGEAGVGTSGLRGFLVVELGPEGAKTEFVPHRPLRRLVRLEGSFAGLSAGGAFAEHREDFVEARLTDEEPVLDPSERLKLNFPYLLSVRQSAFETRLATGGEAVPMDSGGDPDDPGRILRDFGLFHREMRGMEADVETLALVRDLIAASDEVVDESAEGTAAAGDNHASA